MKDIVNKISRELLEAEEDKKVEKITAFVKSKLQRIIVLESEISRYRDEIIIIRESLSKIEEEDYSEINFSESMGATSVTSTTTGLPTFYGSSLKDALRF